MRTPPTAQPQTRLVSFRLGLIAMCGLALLTACPDTEQAALVLREVKVIDGDVRSTTFTLEALGRGFGVRSVSFDVDKGEGEATPPVLSLEIFDEERGIVRLIPNGQISVETPQRLVAEAVLTSILPRGLYDIALLEDDQRVRVLENALEVGAGGPGPTDGGVTDAPIDTGVDDTGVPDTGVPDTGPEDTGPPDTGLPPDSGLGPFVGDFAYRQFIDVDTATNAPAGVTIRVPVPHAALVTSGQALVDGADLAVYQGTDRLAAAWDDRLAVGTDQLEIVAQLIRPIEVDKETDPLVLYYGDPAAVLAIDETVFALLERFPNEVNPWNENSWNHCEFQRPVESSGNMPEGAYCVADEGSFASTLATPRQDPITISAPGTHYEFSFHMTGRTIDGPADIVYFSYSNNDSNYSGSIEIPIADFNLFPPNGMLTFNDNGSRTVNGWRFSPTEFEWWLRTRGVFASTLERPSLHFRYVSLDNDSDNQSGVALDDFWVRLAIAPLPPITLGPQEPR